MFFVGSYFVFSLFSWGRRQHRHQDSVWKDFSEAFCTSWRLAGSWSNERFSPLKVQFQLCVISGCIYTYIYISLSLSRSKNIYISLYIYLSIYLHLYLYLSVYLSIFLLIFLSFYLYFLSISISIYISMYIYI